MPFDFFPGENGPWNDLSGCKNWLAEGMQWRAAFKNIPFAVETDDKGGGRRVHVHEYPAKEWWDNEDLGRLREQFDVTAYVFGDSVDLWAEMLFAACVDKLKGTLILPMRAPVEARCLTINSTWRAGTLGRMDIAMRFSLESGQAVGVVPSSYRSETMLQGLVRLAVDGVVDMARQTFEKAFTNSLPHVGRTEAVKAMQQVAAHLTNANKKARTAPKYASDVAFSVQRIKQFAAELADSQRTQPNTLTNTAAVLSQKLSGVGVASASTTPNASVRASTQQVIAKVGSYSEGFGGEVERALGALVRGAPNPGDLVQALEPMMKMVPTTTVQAKSAVITASTKAEIELAETVSGFARRMAIAYGSHAAQTIAPTKQPDATNARNRVLANLDTETSRAAASVNMHERLRKLRGAVTEYTSWWSQNGGATRRIRRAGVEPLANIASDLYKGTANNTRDVQLMRMNGIRHPLHSPMEVSALK